MNTIPSGTHVVSKNGGPKMKVRWYIDNAHIEASWYQNYNEMSAVFPVAEIEIWDDSSASNIEVVEFVIENPLQNIEKKTSTPIAGSDL